MSESTDGVLAYGYNLGGADDGWSGLAEDHDGNDGLDDDWEALTTRLYSSIPADAIADEMSAEEAVMTYYGVAFEIHCSCEYAMYLLVSHHIVAARGDAVELDLATLAAMPAANDWDTKLNRAIEVLGIKPKQARPGWLLASLWC
jgi:hypothetical protein